MDPASGRPDAGRWRLLRVLAGERRARAALGRRLGDVEERLAALEALVDLRGLSAEVPLDVRSMWSTLLGPAAEPEATGDLFEQAFGAAPAGPPPEHQPG